MSLFWFLNIYHHSDWQSIQFNFLKSSNLVQTVLCFSNSFSSSIWKHMNLIFLPFSPSLTINILMCPLNLGNSKSNGLITLSNVSTNFEVTFLSSSTFQIFIVFLHHRIFPFYHFCLAKSQYYNILSYVTRPFWLMRYLILL